MQRKPRQRSHRPHTVIPALKEEAQVSMGVLIWGSKLPWAVWILNIMSPTFMFKVLTFIIPPFYLCCYTKFDRFMHIYALAAKIKVNIFFVMISQNFNLTNCQSYSYHIISYHKSYFGTDDQASGTGGLQMWVVSRANNIIYLLYLHEVCHHTNNSNHMLSKYMIFASFFLFWARLHTELISINSPLDLNIIRQDHTLLKYTSDYFQRIFVISRTCCTSSFTLKVPSFH